MRDLLPVGLYRSQHSLIVEPMEPVVEWRTNSGIEASPELNVVLALAGPRLEAAYSVGPNVANIH